MIQNPSFFRNMLGAKAEREVKVSRAFAACFTTSGGFRRIILRLLWDCREVDRPHPPIDNWRCDTEVVVSNGRLDLQITSTDAARPVFRLENKLEAPLTAGQLKRYRKRDGKIRLIAVTKYAPDVGQPWLDAHRCYSLRWQEIHRALTVASGLRGNDAFLCHEFRHYLEELDMAHRDDIRLRELQELRRLFCTVTADRQYSGMDARNAVDIFGSCLDLLQDVAQEAVAREPGLATWVRRGPGYIKWQENRSRDHYLAFRFLKKGWNHWIGAGFVFPEARTGTIAWVVQGKTPTSSEFYRQYPLRDVCTDGALDQVKLVRRFFAGIARRGWR